MRPKPSTEESGRSTGGLAPLQSLDVHLDRYPLTAQQRAVWSECQRQPQTHGNVSCAAVVRPRVDADKLRAAYRSISERHAMLRTSLIQVDEDWMQHVQARGQVAFSEVDATDLPAQQLSQLIAERVNRPFDLAAASLARVEILRRDAHSDVILLCAHPAIADAWSMTVLLRDLCVEYQALCTGEASVDRSPAFSYEDYARWEEQLLASDAAGHTLDYWVEQLDGAPAEVQLPTDRPRQIVEAAHEASFPLELDDELTLSLLALSAEQTVPLRVTMFAAYALLLHARPSSQTCWSASVLTDARSRHFQTRWAYSRIGYPPVARSNRTRVSVIFSRKRDGNLPVALQTSKCQSLGCWSVWIFIARGVNRRRLASRWSKSRLRCHRPPA